MHSRGMERAKVLKHRAKGQRGGAQKEDDGVDRTTPGGLGELSEQWLEMLTVRGYSKRTVEGRRHSLSFVLLWLQERDIRRPEEVTRPILEAYQRALYRYRQPSGKPLSFTTQHMRLTAVKLLFKWLCRQDRSLSNPASELEMPRIEKRLPQIALTHQEVEQILGQPDISDPLGVRDRAILEVFYSTGIRRSELMRLQLADLNRERQLLAVRQGKGSKDRVVPIGERALKWTERYLDDVRPELVDSAEEQALFVSAYGEIFGRDHLSRMVKRYIDAAEIGKKGSCHLLRHSMATAMLENGADVRYVQEMLGHSKMETTAIYTHVTVFALQKVHTLTHPAKI